MISTLKNAPITEAILDIRFKLRNEPDFKIFKDISESIKKDYPQIEEIKQRKAQISFESAKQSLTTDETLWGYRNISSDNTKVVLFKTDGFTFSKLKPYKNWEDLRDEAQMFWSIVIKKVEIELIFRVALRYINNLNIPPPFKAFSDYLKCPPQVPEGLPTVINSYIYRVTVPNIETDITAHITQALDKPVEYNKHVPIILDIDVFKTSSIGFNNKQIWETLEELRLYKNKIFRNSIQDELMEVYK